jgi:hypothetical protein
MLALAIAWMAGEWILLVAGTRLHEMMVGAASVAAAGIFLDFVQRSSTLRIKIQPRDLLTGWRVPGYIAVDTWIVLKVLLEDLFSIRRASSLYRVSGFKTSNHDPVLVGRRVLATVYTSVSPNSIVIGIDCEQSRMLVHQVQRSALSAMDKELGARP